MRVPTKAIGKHKQILDLLGRLKQETFLWFAIHPFLNSPQGPIYHGESHCETLTAD